MRYLKSKKVFESREETSKICEEFGISNWSINERGLVDVNGHVQLTIGHLKKLPLKFGHVTGNFNCYNNQLTSLEGAPESVEGDFDCNNNQLTSLEGAPESVEGDFYCSSNQLTSLEGAPESVEGDFDCSNNQLTSLEGGPKSVSGYFSCYNNQLTSLEGAPESVSGHFDCSYNQLTSLEGAPERVRGDFWCSYNTQLTSFDWTPKYIGGDFTCDETPISAIWDLFRDWTEIDLFNDCDPIRGDSIDLNRLNYFLETIGKKPVSSVWGYKILN